MAPPPTVSSGFAMRKSGRIDDADFAEMADDADHEARLLEEADGTDEMDELEAFEPDESDLMIDEDDDAHRQRSNRNQSGSDAGSGGEFKCSVCEFTTRSRVTLQRHERLTHLKKKFFRCVKCNYVTHVKARYTKHVKYHSMPMIKCDLCEFRTPYKWNLDRHLKNHMGGGMYQCSLCNFTAHIKQSLTVHIQNHHLSPDKARSVRRRNKVGASDQLLVNDPGASSHADVTDADEAELLRLERMEHDDASPSAFVQEDELDQAAEASELPDPEVKPKRTPQYKPAKDPVNLNFLRPDDLVHKNGRVYVRNLPCSQCDFKAVWESELARHEAKMHGPAAALVDLSVKAVAKASPEPVNYSVSEQAAKKARPVPNLIRIAPPSSPSSAPTILKIPQLRSWDESNAPVDSSPVLDALGSKNKSEANASNRKKKAGFLDELAQKLAGNIEPSAPKQEEASAAAGSSITISWSSRCQHCRQRCKTRADLLSHLKQCQRALEASEKPNQQPHPMENKVFVWNPTSNTSSTPPHDESSESATANSQIETEALMMMMMMEEDDTNKRPSSVAGSDVSEASLIGVETAPGIGAVTGGAGAAGAGVLPAVLDSRSTVRRVYRCPQCSFWATTASRFHVHMVGHTNTKPFECSQCSYRSNWRWDITKHIKLKAARDPAHSQARVLLLDASGERHYDQYDRYLVMMRVTESGGLSLTHGRFGADDSAVPRSSKSTARRTESLSPSPSQSPSPSPVPSQLTVSNTADQPFNLTLASNLASLASALLPPPPPSSVRQPPGLNVLNLSTTDDTPSDLPAIKPFQAASHPRRTIWKCKRCTFKDHNRETVLQHIRSSHYHPVPTSSIHDGGVGISTPAATNIAESGNGKGDAGADEDSTALTVSCTGLTSGGQVAVAPAGLDAMAGLMPPAPNNTSPGSSSSTPAFRCGVCNQVSNWKHVIQRHCRLKHNGNIQVIENRVTDEDGPELSREGDDSNPPPGQPSMFISPAVGNGAPKTEKTAKRIRRDSPLLGDEDSMGYLMQQGQYSCSTCPFVCKSLADIETHRQHHKPGPGRPVKCTLCSYFTADKQDLAQHLFLHGMHDLKMDSSGHLSSVVEKFETNISEDVGFDATLKTFRCDCCPFTSESKNQFVYHRQFHRPRGAPYKCPQCSYNVSRRHLLNQHLSVHNLPAVNLLTDEQNSDSEQLDSEAEAEAEAAEAIEMAEEEAAAGSSPSHYLTSSTNSAASADGFMHLGLDPNAITRLADSATVALADIPLTWVSRGQKFYKMFKCRFCPHVNVRKANIQEHEKRHQTRPSGTGDNMHACTQCNYRCNNAGVLSAHVKVHQHILGIVHGLADASRPDDEQLMNLAGVSGRPKSNDVKEADESCSSMSSSSGSLSNQPNLELLLGRENKAPDQGLHFCAHCPARFLVETELLIHQRFHGLNLSFRCDVCSYTARKENHLSAHWKVHSREYQERTKVLIEQHGVSEKHPQPEILAVPPAKPTDDGVIDLSSHANKEPMEQDNWICCPLCPAKFASDSKALQYHTKLHGSRGPFRCRFCNYAVKAQDNLLKHEKLHLAKQHCETQGDSEDSKASPKRFQCSKCPSTFEKKEQFKVHCSLHGSKQRFQCDKCDYAAKYYANYLQHVRKHEAGNSGESCSTMESIEVSEMQSLHMAETNNLTTADRQQIWLQDKLRSAKTQPTVENPFYCQFCPFRCDSQIELAGHSERHGVNGATGNYRCSFCDFTVTEQAQLSEHIGLHFQLKGRAAARLPESYWKCSNLEIWSEPVEADHRAEPKLVYNEKAEGNGRRGDDDEDDDTLYIDLNTGQPLRDEADNVALPIANP